MGGRVEGKVCVITGPPARSASRRRSGSPRRAAGWRSPISRPAASSAVRPTSSRTGGDAAAFTVDVTDSDSVERLYRDVHARFGRIDVCFNNAGVLLAGDGDPVETPLDLWLKVLAINQTGVFLCLKHQLPYLLEGGGGSIINTASMVALQGSATPQIAYDATKGAVVTISRDVAVTYGRRGIRCNALCPGPIETPLFRTIFGQDPEGLARRLVHNPMGRVGTAEEVAHAVVYLASDESSWTSGTAFLVDGAITNAYTTAAD